MSGNSTATDKQEIHHQRRAKSTTLKPTEVFASDDMFSMKRKRDDDIESYGDDMPSRPILHRAKFVSNIEFKTEELLALVNSTRQDKYDLLDNITTLPMIVPFDEDPTNIAYLDKEAEAFRVVLDNLDRPAYFSREVRTRTSEELFAFKAVHLSSIDTFKVSREQ
jgi:hypothetical protein